MQRHRFVAIVLTAIFCLSGCNFFDPNGDVSGSVFIVTAGNGSYKLGLVKVYFCPEDAIKKALDPIQADFSKEDLANFQKAMDLERKYRDASMAAVAAEAKQLSAIDGLKKLMPEVTDCKTHADQFADDTPDGSFEEGPNSAPTAPTSPPIPAGAPSITTP
jgi:hypothetical protein